MYIINFTAGAKKFRVKYSPGQVLNILKKFLSDKKLVSYHDPRNSSEATFTQVPNLTLSNQSYILNVNLPNFIEVQSVFRPGLVLFTRVHHRICH